MHQVDISPVAANPVDLLLDDVLLLPTTGVAAPPASSFAFAIAPTVSATRSATIAAVPAVSNGVAIPPAVGGQNSAFVTAVRATSTASAPAPTVRGDANVAAVVAASTSRAFAPLNPVNAAVTAPTAGSASAAPAPVVSGETVLTGGGPAAANAFAIAPSVSIVTVSPPAFASVGAEIGATGSTLNFPVPAGVTGVASECVLAFLLIEGTTPSTLAPGFAEIDGSPVQVTSGPEIHDLRIYWKRPVAADSGTYDFDCPGLTGAAGFAARFTGCLAAGTPLFGTGFVDVDNSNNTTPAASIATGPNRLAIWVATNFHGTGVTFAGGFTERSDDGSIAFATLPVASAGNVPTSGSLVATTGSNAQSLVWLGTLFSPSFPP